MKNRKGNITPSSIIVSCVVIVILVLGLFLVASSSLSYYNNTIDESFSNSMDKSNELVEQTESMSGKLDDSEGVQDPGTGSLIFDGLNTMVLGIKATRAIASDFTRTIGSTLGVNTLIIDLIICIILIAIIAAIVSALWSREV